MKNLGRMTKATAVYGVTTTTANSTLYGDRLDMAECDNVMLLAMFRSTAGSTGTAVLSLVGSNSSTAAAAAYSSINGATLTVAKSTAALDKRLAVLSVDQVCYRYVRSLVNKKAKILLQGVTAIQYGGPYQPASTGTTTNVLCVAGT